MYCHACGVALSQQMKFCNRCGVQLISTSDSAVIKGSEKRLDKYLEGLFWVTVFGLAFIFGGLVLLKRFQFNKWIMLAYLLVSSSAFFINFGVNLWAALRLIKGGKPVPATLPATQVATNELNPAEARPALNPPPSVTEHTTRTFMPVYDERRDE